MTLNSTDFVLLLTLLYNTNSSRSHNCHVLHFKLNVKIEQIFIL